MSSDRSRRRSALVALVAVAAAVGATALVKRTAVRREDLATQIASGALSAMTSVSAAIGPGKPPAGPSAAVPAAMAASLDARIAILQNELLDRARQLDDEVKRAGLDGEELNARYNQVSEDEFFASLPEPVRSGYRELHARVAVLQDLTLERDGKTRADLVRVPEAAPDWVVRHAVALEQVVLSPAVSAFVAAKSRAPSIANDDLRRLAGLCGSVWPCIERATYELLKANHQLTDEQFALLARYQ